jgi:hypothetical protein
VGRGCGDSLAVIATRVSHDTVGADLGRELGHECHRPPVLERPGALHSLQLQQDAPPYSGIEIRRTDQRGAYDQTGDPVGGCPNVVDGRR